MRRLLGSDWQKVADELLSGDTTHLTPCEQAMLWYADRTDQSPFDIAPSGCWQQGGRTNIRIGTIHGGRSGAWSPPIPLSTYVVQPFPKPHEASGYSGLWCLLAAVSESVQVPIDLPAMLALTLAAAGIAKKAKVHVRRDHLEPLNLFACVVLEPANRKSAVFGEMTRPLLDFEAEQRDRLRPVVEAN